MNDLIEQIDRLHTTSLGEERIRRNLRLRAEDAEDVVLWCRERIVDPCTVITRSGKNWYAAGEDCTITVNARSYTIITAHMTACRKTR